MNNKPYFLALNRIANVGPKTCQKLLHQWPNLSELFHLQVADIVREGFNEALAHNIVKFNWDYVDADLSWAEQPNHHLITLEDANYPALLKEIYDPPPVLYALGNLRALEYPTLAIVGSRNPSLVGSETSYRFAAELAREKITIVSGLALGIDGKAHQGAMDAFGNTIAVMGCGIDVCYPPRHVKLRERIIASGLIISEFPLKTFPGASHFPRRNRIISGLSLITLVVEAALKSGSLITARFALEQNRDVLAIPGSIHNPKVRGCHYLLQQGAKLVTNSQEVLDELFTNRALTPFINRKSVAIDDKNLVKCIGYELTSVDQIVARSGLGIDEVICDLANLEVQGIIQAVSGGYMRCRI